MCWFLDNSEEHTKYEQSVWNASNRNQSVISENDKKY